MKTFLDSLRIRLALTMLAIFAVGCAGSSLADLAESAHGPGSLWLEEPYQDLVLLVLFAVFCIPVVWLVSAWSLKGVATAAREAHAISLADSPSRISLGRLPSEILPLVSAVNSTIDRLAQTHQIERRFVADAAHQLRTPLTVLGLRLQKARMEGAVDWPSVESDLALMNRLAEQLLDLSRKQQARQARTPLAPTDLGRVAREAAAALTPVIEASGRTMNVMIDGRFVVGGRVDDLRDMVACVLDNAVVHGRGTIDLSLSVASEPEGQCARLVVADAGHGLDPRIGATAFERFSKADGPGSGLGLAIVKEVVDGHGGRVAFLNGPTCQLEIRLPLLDLTTPTPLAEAIKADPRSSMSDAGAH